MPQMIVVDGLYKSYGETKVLENIHMEIPLCRTTALRGSSGRGKTTLLRLLAGLEEPDRGSIEGCGGARFSMVFQEPRLCESLSAYMNVALAAPGKRDEIEEGLRALELEECRDKPVRDLSGGMRSRVALLRALEAEYDILLLDEPFSGLDYEIKKKAADYVKHRSKGKTVIVVTHDRQEEALLEADCYLSL